MFGVYNTHKATILYPSKTDHYYPQPVTSYLAAPCPVAAPLTDFLKPIDAAAAVVVAVVEEGSAGR